jgi:hypothetical protein
MHPITTVALLALQSFVVLFVAFHNWIPLGILNNLKGIRAEFPTKNSWLPRSSTLLRLRSDLPSVPSTLEEPIPLGSFGGCGLHTGLHATVR